MLPAWGFYLVFGIFFTTGRFPILYIILSLLFFFPIFLLGALANQTSRYNFISKEIFFSFKRIWPSWLFVYGTTLVIYVTILLLMYLIYLLDTQTVNSFGNYEHFRIALIMGGTLPLVLGTSFIFYMRMLGILARLVEQVIQDQTESLNN